MIEVKYNYIDWSNYLDTAYFKLKCNDLNGSYEMYIKNFFKGKQFYSEIYDGVDEDIEQDEIGVDFVIRIDDQFLYPEKLRFLDIEKNNILIENIFQMNIDECIKNLNIVKKKRYIAHYKNGVITRITRKDGY